MEQARPTAPSSTAFEDVSSSAVIRPDDKPCNMCDFSVESESVSTPITEWMERHPLVPENPVSTVPVSKALIEIGSVQYGDYRVKVYQETMDKFSYQPLVLLDRSSITRRQNRVSFKIEMWNDDMHAKIMDWIATKRLISGDYVNIQVMEYGEIQLIETNKTDSRNYRIMKHSTSYHLLNKSLQFFLICESTEAAKALVSEMRADPEYAVLDLALECRWIGSDVAAESNRSRVVYTINVPPAETERMDVQPDIVTKLRGRQTLRYALKGYVIDAFLCVELQVEVDNAMTAVWRKPVVPVFSVFHPVQLGARLNVTFAHHEVGLDEDHEHGIFDLVTGTYTVLTTGVYLIFFSGVCASNNETLVEIRVNGISRAASCAVLSDGTCPLVLTATLRLNAGDLLDAFIAAGELYNDNGQQFTRFSAILLS